MPGISAALSNGDVSYSRLLTEDAEGSRFRFDLGNDPDECDRASFGLRSGMGGVLTRRLFVDRRGGGGGGTFLPEAGA